MKIKYCHFIITCLLLFSGNLNFAQNTFEYGSNNGLYLSISDTDIYYEVYGDGHPTILLHGGLGSIANFKNVIPDLSKNFKLYAIDSPMHGRSQSVDSLSYDIIAKYVVDFIDKLNLNKVNIIGYSDGAVVAFLVANIIPDKINKIVFGAGAQGPKSSKPEGLKLLESISPEILPREFAVSYKAKSPNPNDWKKFIYASKSMWLNEVWIPEQVIREIQNDVLVIFGDRDQFIPIEHSIKIYSMLVNSELAILPGIDHEIFKNPVVINPILIQFLSKD